MDDSYWISRENSLELIELSSLELSDLSSFPSISLWCTLVLTAVVQRLVNMVATRLAMVVGVWSKQVGLKIWSRYMHAFIQHPSHI
jgi:hypothetical protein